MSEYKPPFHMTDRIINLVAAISEQVGRIEVLSYGKINRSEEHTSELQSR